MPIDGFDCVKHVDTEVSAMSHFHHLDRKLLLGQPQIKAEVRKDLPDHLLPSSSWHKIAFPSWAIHIISNKTQLYNFLM